LTQVLLEPGDARTRLVDGVQIFLEGQLLGCVDVREYLPGGRTDPSDWRTGKL